MAAYVAGALCILHSSRDKQCRCLPRMRSRTQLIYAAHFPMCDESATGIMQMKGKMRTKETRRQRKGTTVDAVHKEYRILNVIDGTKNIGSRSV
jgi:hypothetical protein